jgi:ABC-2 type transport system permease protein
MGRYFKLYLNFLRFSFSRAMEFRIDFFFRIVMDVFYYGVNIAFFKIIFLHTSLLGGWNEAQMMVFVGCFLVLDALNMTMLANNLYNLPLFINRGDLDYYLIRPVSSLFFLSLRDFAANSFVNLIMAVGILGWAIVGYPGPVSLQGLAFLGLMLLMGFMLQFAVRILTIVPVFWWHSGHGLEIVYWHMVRFVERPDRIFTGVVRVLLLTVLPFGLMASFPARMFLEPFNWMVLLHLLVVTVGFWLVALLLWRRGLRAYSSASS